MKNKSFITSEPFLITQILENQNPIYLTPYSFCQDSREQRFL